MPAENNVVIRLNVKSDTGAIARTQALLRSLGTDANRSGNLFGKMNKKIDFTQRSLTAFEKSAVMAAGAVGKTFKLATMNAGAQLAIFGAGIATVNGLFRVGTGAAKLYRYMMSGLAGLFAMAAAGAGVFAAAMREQAAALSSFQYSTQKQFGPAINQARMALANLERDTQLATLGTKALTAAFQAASKHSEFTGASQAALKQMANFALATGNPEKAMSAAGDFIGLLQKRKATIGQIQKAMKATMGDDMYKKIQQANAKAKKEDKINLGTVKGIREAVMSGKLAKMGGVQDMLETMNGTLIGQLKSYMGQAKSLFADFGQPLLAPVKDAFKEIFHTLKFAFMKISVSFQQFAGQKGIPFIVRVVEKLSNLIVNLSQKYLPNASGWFDKFAKPFQYIKNFFKETLPNTLRPYRESARVITDMFGKIFGPLIGGNVKRVGDLIKDNKVELVDFATATGKLLQNLNKLSGEIQKAFFRLLPVLTPVINSIASLVGMLSKLFGALGNLGGLGGGKGGGTNLLGSAGSALMLGMMFRGKSIIGNKDSYTTGLSNKSMFGRFWNRRMGLPGTKPNPNDAYFTNRYARQMGISTGAAAPIPTSGPVMGVVPGVGGGGAGGARGAAAANAAIAQAGGVAPGQLSLAYLTMQKKLPTGSGPLGRERYAQSYTRGRVRFMDPTMLQAQHLVYNEATKLHGIATVKGQEQRLLGRMGYDPTRVEAINKNASDQLNALKIAGGGSFKTTKEALDEHARLSGLGRPLTVKEQRRLDALNIYATPLTTSRTHEEGLKSATERSQKMMQRREQRAALAVAGGAPGLTPRQRVKQANIQQKTTDKLTRKGYSLLAKSRSLETKGLNYEAQARAATAAGDHEAAAALQKKANLILHKSAVAGGESDKLLKKYVASGTGPGQRAGDTERRRGNFTGRRYYNEALATRRERKQNAQQGYATGTAGGVTVEGRKEQLLRQKTELLTRGQDLRAQSKAQFEQGQFVRSKISGIQAKIAEQRAKGGIFGLGKAKQLSQMEQAGRLGGVQTGAGFRGRMAGLNFKKFSMGGITGKLGPGGPGLLGAKDENGMYRTKTGRALGGQNQGVNMATSIGMSFLASKGVGDEGGMALGASLAPMFGPLAALGVGFGISALKAKTAKGGAAAGAIAGAAIGTMIPGIGTAVGAAIGAVVGFAAGYINRKKLEKKAAQGVAKAMIAGYEQRANYDAFTKFTEVAPSAENKYSPRRTRADFLVEGFSRMSRLAKLFDEAGGKNATYAGQKNAREKMIDDMVATGQMTPEQAKDAKKNTQAFTDELKKQAKTYEKVGKVITDTYNPKIDRMAKITGKSAAELEKMANTMGVDLLDPTLTSIEALKSLGYFISKTAAQLKTELSNAIIDAVKGLQEWNKAQNAPLVMNEIAQGFGEKGRAGGLVKDDIVSFITNLAEQSQVVNPNDSGAALQLILSTLGVGANGEINPSATVFSKSIGGPLAGLGDVLVGAQGNEVLKDFLYNKDYGLISKMQFDAFSQLGAMADEGGMVLPTSVKSKLDEIATSDPVLFSKIYSNLIAEKEAGRFSINQQTMADITDTTKSADERAAARTAVNAQIESNLKRVLGEDVFNQLNFKTTQLTESTTAQEKTQQAQIDLMSDGEKAVLESLTKQWSDIAKSFTTGSAPDWFTNTPMWWSTPPSWYDGDTPTAKGLTHDTPTSRVAATLARHRQIDSTITGKRTVTSSLRNYGLGSLKSDHVTGNAYDLVGQNLGAYAVAVKNSGGFAEFHGGQGNRHLHVVPTRAGDSSMPAAIGLVPQSSGGSVSNSFTITINGSNQDPEAIANAVMDKIKRAQRSLNERS